MRKIVTEAVEIEKEFVCDALAVRARRHERRHDERLHRVRCRSLALGQLGFAKEYNTANPFDWMELISLQGKTNFFEKRVGEYQKSLASPAGLAPCLPLRSTKTFNVIIL